CPKHKNFILISHAPLMISQPLRMRIFVPKEIDSGETRAPLTPSTAAKLTKLGAQVEIETRLGESIHFPDDEYRAAGAAIAQNREQGLRAADLVLRLRKPPAGEI